MKVLISIFPEILSGAPTIILLLFLISCNLFPDRLVIFAGIEDGIKRIEEQAMRLRLIFMYLEILFNVISQVIQLLDLFLYPFCDVLLEDFIGVYRWPRDARLSGGCAVEIGRFLGFGCALSDRRLLGELEGLLGLDLG